MLIAFTTKACLKLVSNVSLQRSSRPSFVSVGLNENDNFRGARLLAFSIQKVCLDLKIEMFTLRISAGNNNLHTLLMHCTKQLRELDNFNFKFKH